MTSHGEIPDVVDTLRDGAVDYVTKPFDPDEFTRQVVGPSPSTERCGGASTRRAHGSVARDDRGAAGRGVAEDARRGRPHRAARAERCRGRRHRRARRPARSSSPTRCTRRGRDAMGRSCSWTACCCPSCCGPRSWRSLASSGPAAATWFREAAGGTLVLGGSKTCHSPRRPRLVRLISAPAAIARRDADGSPLGMRLITLSPRAPDRPDEPRRAARLPLLPPERHDAARSPAGGAGRGPVPARRPSCCGSSSPRPEPSPSSPPRRGRHCRATPTPATYASCDGSWSMRWPCRTGGPLMCPTYRPNVRSKASRPPPALPGGDECSLAVAPPLLVGQEPRKLEPHGFDGAAHPRRRRRRGRPRRGGRRPARRRTRDQSVGDGATALERLTATSFDVVITRRPAAQGGRARAVPAQPRAGPEPRRDPDDVVRLRHGRGGRAEAGRARLPHEAIRRRRARAARGCDRASGAACSDS